MTDLNAGVSMHADYATETFDSPCPFRSPMPDARSPRTGDVAHFADAAGAIRRHSPVVFIASDAPAIRDSLDVVAGLHGWVIRKLPAGSPFLDDEMPPSPCCLLLDVGTPGLDAVEVQEHVATHRPGMPILVVNGAAGAPTMVIASSTQPVHLFAGPPAGELFVALVSSALERSGAASDRWERMQSLRMRYGQLSRREREVMSLVVAGRANKVVGFDLGISEITVKAHRGSIMRKMSARSLPCLVKMAACLGLEGAGDF